MIAHQYSWDEVAQRTMIVYKELLQTRKTAPPEGN